MESLQSQWKRLYEQKKNELSEAGRDDAFDVTSLDDLHHELTLLMAEYRREGVVEAFARLEPTFRHLSAFTSAISSATQYKPTACLVWGVVQAVIKASCLFSPEIVSNMLEVIASLNESLPEMRSYLELLPKSFELGLILQDIYDNYMDYCIDLLHYVKKSYPVQLILATFFSIPQQSLAKVKEVIDKNVKLFRRTATLIYRQEERNYQVQQHEQIRQLIDGANLIGNPPEPTITTNVTFPVSTITAFQNYTFCGRRDELEGISNAMNAVYYDKDGKITTRGPVCYVLHGLGGIGKTQIALEFAYRNRSVYDARFWIESEQDSTLKSTYATIADTLRLTKDVGGVEGQYQARAIERAREWLQKSDKKWLLVFDNVEDFEDLSPYFPADASPNCTVIITTQLQSFPQITDMFTLHQVHALDEFMGSELLFKYMKRDPRDQEEEEAAAELSQLLDGLPLGLSTIGGYLNQTESSVMRFLDELKMSSAAWVATVDGEVKQYKRTLATVFNMAFSELTDPARSLLNILAFLNPDEIPEDLFTPCIGKPPLDFLQTQADLADAVGSLRRRQLIKRDIRGSDPYLSIHRTVQWNVLLDLSNDYQHRWKMFNNAFILVKARLPQVSAIDNPEPELWAQFEKYVPQVLSVRNHCLWPEPPVQLPETFAQVLSDMATYMWHAGIFKEGSDALHTAENILDTNEISDEHPLRGNIHAHLGIFASFEGVSERQEAIDRRHLALEARKKSLEGISQSRLTREDDIRRYNVESDMAFGLMQLEDFGLCEIYIEKCHDKYKEWGTEEDIPFEYLKYNHIISYVRMFQGRPVDAIKHCRKAAELGQICAGLDHPMTQLVKFTLGNHLYLAGELEDALEINQDVLQYRKQVCGRYNHFTLESHSMCGALLLEQQRYEEALHHLETCLDRRKRTLWNEEGVTRAQYFYAKALEGLNRHEEAKRELESAQRIKARYLKDYPKYVKPSEVDLEVFDQMVCLWSGRFTEAGKGKRQVGVGEDPESGRKSDEAELGYNKNISRKKPVRGSPPRMDNRNEEKKEEKSQPWKAVWPPKQPVEPQSTPKAGKKVILIDGGGAYPNKIKETEGTRL